MLGHSLIMICMPAELQEGCKHSKAGQEGWPGTGSDRGAEARDQVWLLCLFLADTCCFVVSASSAASWPNLCTGSAPSTSPAGFCREAFDLFDTDGSGTIDAKELKVAMR